MPDDLEIRVSTPGAEGAKQALRDLAQGESRVAGEGEKAAQAGGRIRSAFRGLAGLLGIGGGMTAGAAMLRSILRDADQHMQSIARNAQQVSANLGALAMLKGGAAAVPGIREVAAPLGVKPQPALGTFQAMLSQTGDLAAAAVASEQAWLLGRTGVPGEAAGQAVSIGIGLGMGVGEAARAPLAAGMLSTLTPAEMVQAAPQALPAWRGAGGPMMGYQTMAFLSRVIKRPGPLGTATAQVARALSRRSPEIDRMWKKLGVSADAGPTAKLRALKAGGLTTSAALQQAGLGAAEETQALSIILGDLPGYEAVGPQLAGLVGQTGLLQTTWDEMAEVPQVAATQARAIQAAHLDWERHVGARGTTAIERSTGAVDLARAMEDAGVGFLTGGAEEAAFHEGFLGASMIPGARYGPMAQAYSLLTGGGLRIPTARGVSEGGRDMIDLAGRSIIQMGTIFNGVTEDPAAQIPRTGR